MGSLGNHPTLEGIDDVEIVQGTHFDIMEGVKASDGNGNDTTHQIKILKNTVNTEEVGTYEVIYSITNSQGNNIQRTRKVEVIKNESEKKKYPVFYSHLSSPLKNEDPETTISVPASITEGRVDEFIPPSTEIL